MLVWRISHEIFGIFPGLETSQDKSKCQQQFDDYKECKKKEVPFPPPNSSLASYVRPRVYAGQQVPNLKFKLVFSGL
jgi:hypothetical protein